MADWHLKDLDDVLTKAGWRIVTQASVEERGVSVTWEIQRSDSEPTLLLDFGGWNRDGTGYLPLSESYGVSVRGHMGRGLYFGKPGEYWKKSLHEFVAELGKEKTDGDS